MMTTEIRSPTLGKRPDRAGKGSSPGPVTRRMRTALAGPEDLKLAGPKSLLAQLDDDRDDDDFAPGADSEVEEEFDEGDAERDDERPPFADGGLMPADPALVEQLDADDDGADDGEFGAAEAAEGEAEEIAEEYDEGPVVDDERPPFADADVAAVDPVMAAAVLGIGPEVVADEDNDDDDDFTPGAEEGEVIAEEYDEGPIVDDERPPFADADVAAADPALVKHSSWAPYIVEPLTPTPTPTPSPNPNIALRLVVHHRVAL
jgi:hypothetical protein